MLTKNPAHVGNPAPCGQGDNGYPPKATSRAPFPMQGLEQRLGLPIKLLSKVGLPRTTTNPQGQHNLTG